MLIKLLPQTLVSLNIFITAAVCGEIKTNTTMLLSETDCGFSEEFCDLISLSEGFKIVEVNSSGTHWKVNENKTCNITQLTFHEPVTIDKSVLKACNKIAIFFKGSNYDCNIELWMRFLNLFSEKTMYMDASGTNCSSLLGFEKECGNTSDFIYQTLCMDSLTKFGGSRCNFSMSRGDFSIFIECANKSLTDFELPKQLPQRSKRLYMEDNWLTNVDGWFEDVLPQLHMVEQINLSRNRLMKLPFLPVTDNPIEHIYIESNNQDFEFDKAAFESYLHYQNLVLSFNNTKWICNCKTRDFEDFLIDNMRIFNDLAVMFCGGGNDLQWPWTFDTSHCGSREPAEPFDYLSFLVIPLLTVVNVSFIAIFVDFNRIIWREKKGLTNHRAPWIHTLIIKLTGRDWLDINN